jgi:hypothetical protein
MGEDGAIVQCGVGRISHGRRERVSGGAKMGDNCRCSAEMVRVDAGGDTLWSCVFAGSALGQEGRWAEEDAAGNLLIAGSRCENMLVRNAWIIKIDAAGDLEWDHTYGGAEHDLCAGGQVTSDGGCILWGPSSSCVVLGSLAVRVDGWRPAGE